METVTRNAHGKSSSAEELHKELKNFMQSLPSHDPANFTVGAAVCGHKPRLLMVDFQSPSVDANQPRTDDLCRIVDDNENPNLSDLDLAVTGYCADVTGVFPLEDTDDTDPLRKKRLESMTESSKITCGRRILILLFCDRKFDDTRHRMLRQFYVSTSTTAHMRLAPLLIKVGIKSCANITNKLRGKFGARGKSDTYRQQPTSVWSKTFYYGPDFGKLEQDFRMNTTEDGAQCVLRCKSVPAVGVPCHNVHEEFF